MMTISVQFDPKSLPDWARGNKDIVALCKSDLAFRADVFRATTSQMRRLVALEAKRIRSRIENQ